MPTSENDQLRALLNEAATILDGINKTRWARFCRKTPDVLDSGNTAILILLKEFFEPKGDYERMTRKCGKEALHLGIEIYTLAGKLGS